MHPGLAAYPAHWRPGRAPPLEDRAVHLCLIRLPDTPELPRLAARERARQLAAVALRALLRGYGVPDPAFRLNPHGRPALDPPPRPPLDFNYSHAGGWALFAFARQRVLGVDLEIPPRRFINPDRLAAARLTPAERRAWRAFPDRSRDTALLACWTRKEAHGKALGVGVRYPMQTTCLFADPGRWDWRADGVCGLQLALPDGGLAALAYTGEPIDPAQLHTWQPTDAALSLRAA